MVRAEITRTTAPPCRKVNEIWSRRPSSVIPRAWYRGSPRLCPASASRSSGSLRNTCSASVRLTPCLSRLFRSFPASQSNRTGWLRATMTVYGWHIRSRSTIPVPLLPLQHPPRLLQRRHVLRLHLRVGQVQPPQPFGDRRQPPSRPAARATCGGLPPS